MTTKYSIWMAWPVAGLLLLAACQDPPMTPKPRAYPKVIYPRKAYRPFEESYCQFTFDYPAYARIDQDTSFLDADPVHDCWFDIFFPDFDSRIHFTYYPLNGQKSLEALKREAFEMVDWHQKKANYIDEIPIRKPDARISGFAFDIGGPAASPFQFFLTDSTHHFLRGALYFNTQARPDSLAPIYAFVKDDILKMIDSFRWVE